MQDVQKLKFGIAALILGLGALASARVSAQDVIAVAHGVNMWDESLGVAYRFHWGEVGLGARNLTYQLSDRPIVQKVRYTGPVFGATFRW